MIDQPRFVVLGTGGDFTTQVLNSLLEQNVQPLAYIQWSESNQAQAYSAFGIPVEVKKAPDALSDLLARHRVEFFFKSADLSLQLHALDPEFLLVACWPELIEPNALQQASNAALNLHPSLLPKYRGIDPIGEQLKQLENRFGVSLHLLSNEYDCGDIVAQSEVFPKNKTSRKEIESACAKKGAELFIEALQRYHKPGWTLRSQND